MRASPSRLLLAYVTLSCGCFIDAVGAPANDDGAGGQGGQPTSTMNTGASDTTPSSGASGGGGSDVDVLGGGGSGTGGTTACGNAQIDPGEDCDGQEDCTDTCELGPDSLCFEAPLLPLGATLGEITGSSTHVFVSFDDFGGTSCEEADVPADAGTQIYRYVVPALYPEGLFASAAIDGDEPVIYAVRGCGAEPLDCGAAPEDALGRILVPVQPPGSVLFVGVLERRGEEGSFELYARPFRYYDSFLVSPADWSLSGGWLWSTTNKAVELPRGANATMESNEILVGGLEQIFLGFSYRTDEDGSVAIALSFDGDDFVPAEGLPPNEGNYVWRDIVEPIPSGAERMRIRLVGEDQVSITTVMVGPVVPGSIR